MRIRIDFRRLMSLLFIVLATFAVFAIRAIADTGPSPLPTSGAPTSVNGWYVLLAPVLIAVLDFVFAINSKAKSNGVLHWIWLALGGKENPPS